MIANDRPGAVVYVLTCNPVDTEDLRRTHIAVAEAFDDLIQRGVQAMSMSAHVREAAIAVLTTSRQHLP